MFKSNEFEPDQCKDSGMVEDKFKLYFTYEDGEYAFVGML